MDHSVTSIDVQRWLQGDSKARKWGNSFSCLLLLDLSISIAANMGEVGCPLLTHAPAIVMTAKMMSKAAATVASTGDYFKYDAKLYLESVDKLFCK